MRDGHAARPVFCEARREWRDAMRCESWRRPRPLPQKSDVFSAEWSSKRAATTNAVIYMIGEGRTRCTYHRRCTVDSFSGPLLKRNSRFTFGVGLKTRGPAPSQGGESLSLVYTQSLAN